MNFFSNDEERQKYSKDVNLNFEEDIKDIFPLEEERKEKESILGSFWGEIHDYSLEKEMPVHENIDTILSDLFPMDFFSLPKEQIEFDNFSNINIQNQKTKSSTNNNIIFNLKIEKKVYSGKKRKKELKEGEERHNKYYPDNVLRKIQVHSINYIFDLINEILCIKGYKDKFLSIPYKFKKEINKNKVMKLKQSLIGDIINQNISKKYRTKCIEDIQRNMNLFNQVKNDTFFREILNETYLSILRNYYLKDKNDIIIDGFHFKLEKVKTIKDLKNKYNEDKRYIYMINEVIEKNYLPKDQFKSI